MKAFLQFVLLFFCVYTFGQTTVKGNVTDDSGQPLPGANVIVVGTTTGVFTDFDGNYTLTVDLDPPFTIQISSIGFQTTRTVLALRAVLTHSFLQNHRVLHRPMLNGWRLSPQSCGLRATCHPTFGGLCSL